ncbi:hypothetical protein BGX26_010862 [Mortierella sp. AD094]|nr:hypothetical protein BGX26_010862 [Mortierella sp. AD094]
MSKPVDDPIPTVLIVGAGLGGLMLGAVLETTSISYHILEQATELQPLGSVISLTGDIFLAFEQLGIYDELKNISLPSIAVDMFDIKLNTLGSLPSKHLKIAILVGADGAYSAVRQSMYKKLEEKGTLPLGDKDAFSIGYINMVGISTPPNPEKYPQLSEKNRSHARIVMGDDRDSSYVVSIADNQICWGIQIQLPEGKAKEQHFTNSEWGPESIDAMLKQFQDFPCGFGGTMKEIFNSTPKNLISKVFLEEKVFQTWYNGRSVLIGDGAAVAMKDAVVLANCIYNMKDKTDESIKVAFARYYRQHHLEADEMIKGSAFLTNITSGHS